MQNKTIALTGHTSGIGEAIRHALEADGFSVKGFSRTTGYDLADPQTIPRIIADSADCSVFINNARHGWAQTDLLYELFARWGTRERLIINIGSNSGDTTKYAVRKYSAEKIALDAAALQLCYVPGAYCRVTNLRPGWVRTNSVPEVEEPMLDPQEVAGVVRWLIALPPHLHVTALTLKGARRRP